MADFARYVFLPAAFGIVVGLLLLGTHEDHPVRPGYADAVSKAAPAVVNIYTSQNKRPPICEQEAYREWCDRLDIGASQRMQSSLGSGVIVSSDGFILTNNHVVADADEVLVAFHDGQATTAEIIGTDPETDLALIKVRASGLTRITLGRSAEVRVGDIALAIGNPFGLGQTVSAGIVSATGRVGITESPYADFVQTDAAINLGNSGGALVDSDGRLIGINTLIFSRSGGSEGIGFAIPVDLALRVMRQLAESGEVIRGWLGVELAPTPGPGQEIGLRINRLLADGPAAVAGAQVGDLLMAVAGRPAAMGSVVSQQIAATKPGSELVLDILRNDQLLRLIAIPVARPELEP